VHSLGAIVPVVQFVHDLISLANHTPDPAFVF
jgi:hypothetical protein